jgi:hypothetical protein
MFHNVTLYAGNLIRNQNLILARQLAPRRIPPPTVPRPSAVGRPVRRIVLLYGQSAVLACLQLTRDESVLRIGRVYCRKARSAAYQRAARRARGATKADTVAP